jgi:hypothetical protein
MRRKTLVLFQLFLAVFGMYTALDPVLRQYCIVPLLCLVCMFFVGKLGVLPGKTAEEEAFPTRQQETSE